MDIQSLLDNLVFINLLLVTIIYWASLIYSNFKFLEKIGFYGNCCANFLVVILLSLRWLNYGYFPLSNLYESLMFLTWGITFVSLILEDKSKISLLGSITSPIALFVSGFATLSLPESMQAPSPLVPALKSNWLMLHVTVMMLSYASLIIGSLLAIFFLVISFGKGKDFTLQGNSYGTVFSSSEATNNQDDSTLISSTTFYKEEPLGTPPILVSNSQKAMEYSTERLSLLESIDNISYRTISFGFPLLTIGIIAGAVWANEAWGSYWSWDPKETWALITWLVFASYLHARLTKSWQGTKPAIIASFGFVVVWICYLGVNFLGKGLHTYGQIF